MWCDLFGMRINVSKTRTMIVYRSSPIHPQPTPLTLDGTVPMESADVVIFGVTFSTKMTFEVWCHEKILASIA